MFWRFIVRVDDATFPVFAISPTIYRSTIADGDAVIVSQCYRFHTHMSQCWHTHGFYHGRDGPKTEKPIPVRTPGIHFTVLANGKLDAPVFTLAAIHVPETYRRTTRRYNLRHITTFDVSVKESRGPVHETHNLPNLNAFG